MPDSVLADVHGFVAQEVFATLSRETQNGLLLLALAPPLTPDEASKLCDPAGDQVVQSATAAGVVTHSAGVLVIHPLFRAFLCTHARATHVAVPAAEQVCRTLIEHSDWDSAFALANEYDLDSIFTSLLREAVSPLLKSGRTATIARWVSLIRPSLPLAPEVDFAASEVAFRERRYTDARQLAQRATQCLRPADPLLSRAHLKYAQSSYFSEDIDQALEHFRRAREVARTSTDAHEALWGELNCAIYSDHPSADDLLEEFARLDEATPDYRVRLETARLTSRFSRGLEVATAIQNAHAYDSALGFVSDPMIRCAFANALAGCEAVMGRYTEVLDQVRVLRAEARTARLSFALLHADFYQALAELGRRRFAQSARLLHSLIVHADTDRYLTTSACAARARLAAAVKGRLPRHTLALDTRGVGPGTVGDYLASLGLYYAAHDDTRRARECAVAALAATRSLEAAVLAEAVKIIAGDLKPARVSRLAELLQTTGAFDALVSSYRARPALIPALLQCGFHERELSELLSKSRDFELARLYGLETQRAALSGSADLTPRETEVLQLLREGLTNREIASRLFISLATAKIHVRHILEKLGVRSRTEAAVFADAAKYESGDS